jgi:hypothetical protein
MYVLLTLKSSVRRSRYITAGIYCVYLYIKNSLIGIPGIPGIPGLEFQQEIQEFLELVTHQQCVECRLWSRNI